MLEAGPGTPEVASTDLAPAVAGDGVHLLVSHRGQGGVPHYVISTSQPARGYSNAFTQYWFSVSNPPTELETFRFMQFKLLSNSLKNIFTVLKSHEEAKCSPV